MSERSYVFVVLTTGPETGLTAEQRERAFAGHFSNIKRMSEAGKLLVVGPLRPPLAKPDHRGIFVFDETDVAAGMALAETDPTYQVGVFLLTPFLMTSRQPLTVLPRLEKEDEARRLADPNVPDEWSGRAYRLASTPYDSALRDLTQAAPGVLISARLHGSGPEGGDEILAWLDAEDDAQARSMLPEANAWTLHGWYGTKMIAELARRANAG